MDYKISVYLFLLCLFSNVGFGQLADSILTYKLNEIVISANKTKTSSLFVTNSVSVIDSAEISRKERISLLDLLKSEYGLFYTTQGNAGSNSFVNLRGTGAGHTLVLIDGIEMNRSTDPGNTFDFSTVTTDNIEKIEVLRGPQSTLYGSDAMAGVINIFTKKASQGLRLNLSSEGGSYNTYKGNVSISGSKGIFYFNGGLGRTSSNGFSSASDKYGNTEKDGFKNSTMYARTGLNFSEALQLDIRYHFTKAFADLDWAGGPSGDHYSYISDTEETGLRGSINYKPIDNWENIAGISFRRNLRKYSYGFSPVSYGPSDSRYDGNRIKADLQSNIYLTGNIITAGLEYEKEEMNSEFNEYGFSYFSILPKVSNNTYGIFFQNQFSWNSMIINGGIRYDNNEIFGDNITYRLSPAYLIYQTGTKIKGSYGTGFKSPSLTNLFDPMYGNKDLMPEKSRGWEAGAEQYFTKFTAGLTYFKMNFDDLFVYDPVMSRTENLNKSSSQGVEVYLSGELLKDLNFKANYTFTEPKDEINGTETVNLRRKPKHKAAFGIDYNFSNKAYSDLEIVYTGKREDIYFTPDDFRTQTKVLNEYFLVNLILSFNVIEQIKIYTRFENLLNKDYEEIYGFATPGFSVYAGVKLDTGNLINL